MRTRLQGDQVRHHPHPLELQHVPLRASLVDLRMRQVQTEDLQDMHGEGVSHCNVQKSLIPHTNQHLTVDAETNRNDDNRITASCVSSPN
jgi:hypothetical protein